MLNLPDSKIWLCISDHFRVELKKGFGKWNDGGNITLMHKDKHLIEKIGDHPFGIIEENPAVGLSLRKTGLSGEINAAFNASLKEKGLRLVSSTRHTLDGKTRYQRLFNKKIVDRLYRNRYLYRGFIPFGTSLTTGYGLHKTFEDTAKEIARFIISSDGDQMLPIG